MRTAVIAARTPKRSITATKAPQTATANGSISQAFSFAPRQVAGDQERHDEGGGDQVPAGHEPQDQEEQQEGQARRGSRSPGGRRRSSGAGASRASASIPSASGGGSGRPSQHDQRASEDAEQGEHGAPRPCR